jgi:hypothetical protein
MKEDPERRGENPALADDETADVEVFTGVRAKSLRFTTVAEPRVSFDGEPGERSSSKSERENLPDEVEPGVTYRNIGVRWRARSRIDHPSDPEYVEPRPANGESSD